MNAAGITAIVVGAVLAGLAFTGVAAIGIAYALEDTATPTDTWAADNSAYAMAGFVLFEDEFTQGVRDLERERYSQAGDHFQEAEGYAAAVVAELNCYHPDAAPDCDVVREYFSDMEYAMNEAWRCMIDLEIGYDSGDCDDAVAAMENMAGILDDLKQRLLAWAGDA